MIFVGIVFSVSDMTNTVTMNNNNSASNEIRKKRKLVFLFFPSIHLNNDLFCRVKRVSIELGDLTQHNLKQLKVLNRDVFPVAYNEKFYKDLLGAGELCKLGMLKDWLI
jgi:hypothetical protein